MKKRPERVALFLFLSSETLQAGDEGFTSSDIEGIMVRFIFLSLHDDRE